MSVIPPLNVNPAEIKRLDIGLKAIPIAEAPEELYRQLVGAQENFLQMKYSSMPDTANNPAYKDFATIVKDGKTLARINNHGHVISSNALGGKIQRILASEDQNLSGPQLAEARAAAIAKALGGQIVKASMALTQAQYRAVPQPEIKVDYKAMTSDPLFEQLQKTKQARMNYLAQQLGQAG